MAKKYRRQKGRHKKFSIASVNTGGTWETANPSVVKVKRRPAVGGLEAYKASARSITVELLERTFPARFKGTPPGRKEAQDLIEKLGTQVGHQKILHRTEKRLVVAYITDIVYVVYIDGLFGVIKKSMTFGSLAQAERCFNDDTIRWQLVIKHPNTAAASLPSS